MLAMPLLVLASLTVSAEAPQPGAEERALAFLAREVPRWAAENHCYSCHNNGDAARALYAAVRLGLTVPRAALADTTRWLGRPDRWERNSPDGPFNDKKLARLQFAAALVEAADAGLVKDDGAPARAAELVAGHQDADGSWPIDADGSPGSPATHGRALATYLARRTLARTDAKKFAPALARADAWARRAPVKSVPDAAGVLLALGRASDKAAQAQRHIALDLLQKAEARGGGWGPYANAPTEVFDTAVAVLALAAQREEDGLKAMRRRGRAYLVAGQQEDGSWPETTRPSGAQSYAQRLATAGWATLALLATRGE
jgi:hypothetical protein